MIKTIPFQNTQIRYSDTGEGSALVLLHGYLESLEIWNGVKESLQQGFRLICPDLPGHGKSGVADDVHSMELLAESVVSVMDHCGTEKCFIIGHSMGGYAALAFLELYPDRMGGLCLFHSHPFPDTKQVMNNRCREIILVNQGKKELISKINIPRAFAPENLEKLNREVERATSVATATPDDGIIACLNGMMERPSRETLLEKTEKPVLLIAGVHDNYISFEETAKKIGLPCNSRFVALENSGHIGFIEEPEKSALEVKKFINDFL